MVKFTSLLLASVAVLAVSTQAQTAVGPTVAIAAADFERLGSLPESLFEASEVSHSGSLERRAAKKVYKPTPLTAKEKADILKVHNKYRKDHQAPALKWSDKAAAWGNSHITSCEFKHTGGPFGENLAAGYSNFSAAIKAWYDEVAHYDFKKPGFSGATGHFTQVVWKGSKAVGCAKIQCPQWKIYICDYDPAGNIVDSTNSYFKKNVLPKK
ncbi:hypothetical protein BGZ99_003322 [Dissophora globulifera]|uniref:SCP domain-containing protein n=1 Tax=Dissophora globulifera TaxID=979702 RepID=A0A9P6UVC5_9FUNG|nr:hypothetical protein BGZ99_003322 [Dissophora globulifera]